MLPYLEGEFGNPDSPHSPGKRARAAVERARASLANALGIEDPSQIFFTSGATESNQWILRSFDRVIVSPFEHSSLREPAALRGCDVFKNQGFQILPSKSSHDLISVMRANNETGALWDPTEFVTPGAMILSDVTQAVFKVPVDFHSLDFASFSAHKFYGPKGIGALYSRGLPPSAQFVGGQQEMGFRAGTTHVAGVVGMAMAATLAAERFEADFFHACELRAIFLDELDETIGYEVNDAPQQLPHILSISFNDLLAESLIIDCDAEGFAISSGPACSTFDDQPSPVLLAVGKSESEINGTLRISFGRTNSPESTQLLAKTLRRAALQLRKAAKKPVS